MGSSVAPKTHTHSRDVEMNERKSIGMDLGSSSFSMKNNIVSSVDSKSLATAFSCVISFLHQNHLLSICLSIRISFIISLSPYYHFLSSSLSYRKHNPAGLLSISIHATQFCFCWLFAICYCRTVSRNVRSLKRRGNKSHLTTYFA